MKNIYLKLNRVLFIIFLSISSTIYPKVLNIELLNPTDIVSYSRIEFYTNVGSPASNPNNYLNPGKVIKFKLRIMNGLTTNILTGYGSIRSLTPGVTVTDSNGTFNNILAGQEGWSVDDYEISVSENVLPGSQINFVLTVNQSIAPTGPWYSTFSFPIAPLAIGDVLLDDDQFPDSWGDNDHIPEPGETIEIIPLLNNNSEQSIFAASGRLKTNISGITVWNNVTGASGLVYDTWRYNVVSGEPQPILEGGTGIQPELDYVFNYNNNSQPYSYLTFSFINEAYLEENPGISWQTGGILIKWENKLNVQGEGNIIPIGNSTGNCDGSISVTIVNSNQLTGHTYEVFFTQREEIRNANGDWVPSGFSARPEDLTGSSVAIAGIYGPNPASGVELNFSLDLVSSTNAWADGVSITFPAGVTIINAPAFEAGGGTVVPEVVGNTIIMGLVGGEVTQNGIFHGGETWTVFIAAPPLPLAVDWVIYDDGYIDPPGPIVNAVGTFTIEVIGSLSRTAKYWNVKDINTDVNILENQGFVGGEYLFPPRDDLTIPYIDPIIDGFQISVDIGYAAPLTISANNKPTINGVEVFIFSPINQWWVSNSFIVGDFMRFGYPDGWANTSLPLYGGAGGTIDVNLLQQDLEFRFTGVLADTVINGNTLTITQSGGSMATLFGASLYSLADHPLNPSPGVNQPFTVRIPFEVWNVDANQQVNLVFWDRETNPTVNGAAVWLQTSRVYTWVLNTPYSPNLIDVTSQIVVDNATWNMVFYKSLHTAGDVVRVNYDNPAQIGIDKFIFDTDVYTFIEDESIINDFSISQNYPNPFNPITTINYSIPATGIVQLKVFNILGEDVLTLVNEEKQVGNYQVNFNAKNFASGVYFYRLQAGELIETRKMILLK